MGTSHIVSFNLKTRDRIHTTGFAQQQAVVPLITIGFLRILGDLDHPAPDAAGMITNDVFIKQVTTRVRSIMSLLRVVRDQLFFAGKSDPIHFGSGTLAIKEHFLMDMSQFGTNRTCGPLQRRTGFDSSRLMSKVPDLVVPVLNLHITEIRSSRQQQFHCSNV